MTVVNFEFLQAIGPIGGYIEISPERLAVSNGSLVIPLPQRITLVNGATTASLSPSDLIGCGYRVNLYSTAGKLLRPLRLWVPDSPTPIDASDLVGVLPTVQGGVETTVNLMITRLLEHQGFLAIVGSGGTGGTAGVSSFNGRSGTVSPASGDYGISQITGLSTALGAKVDTGDSRLSDARVPIDASVTDPKIGNRTIDQTLGSPGNSGTLTSLLSWMAGRLRAVTGAVNWYDTPVITLVTTKAHVDSVSNPHGVTAAQAGADPVGTASSAIAGHLASSNPHSQYALSSSLSSYALNSALADYATVSALVTGLTSKAPVSHSHTLATTSTDGFMSSADKVKLDGLGSGAGGGATQTDIDNSIAAHVALANPHSQYALSSSLSAYALTSALTSGLATKQPLDADLTAIAALTPTTGQALIFGSSAWESRALLASDIPSSIARVSDLSPYALTSSLSSYALNSSLSSYALTSSLSAYATVAALTGHSGDTGNPHAVTASQVGAATAQWNADKIQGRSVATTAPTDGQVLTWNNTSSLWLPATPSGGGGGSGSGFGWDYKQSTTPSSPSDGQTWCDTSGSIPVAWVYLSSQTCWISWQEYSDVVQLAGVTGSNQFTSMSQPTFDVWLTDIQVNAQALTGHDSANYYLLEFQRAFNASPFIHVLDTRTLPSVAVEFSTLIPIGQRHNKNTVRRWNGKPTRVGSPSSIVGGFAFNYRIIRP
jgi:hypothetical protein